MPINYQGSGGGVPRKTAHIFAKNAANNDVTVFGSTLAQNTQYTDDIADIQNNAFENGWRDAVISNKNYPLLADMNGVQKTFSQQIAYILQHGLAQWDSATAYYTYDIVNVNGVLYICTIDNNVNSNPTSLSGWAVYYDPDGTFANIDLSNLSTDGNDRLHALKSYEDAGELLTDAEGLADVTSYAHSTFDLSKFTVVGSPTISADGIASGFSTSDYLRKIFDSVIDLTTQTLEIETELVYKGNANIWYTNTDYWRIRLKIKNNSVEVDFSTLGVVSTSISANVGDLIKVKLKLSPNGNELKVYINGAFANSSTSTFTSDSDAYNKVSSIALGGCYNAGDFANANLDLKQFSITVDGVPVFSGNQTGIDTIKPNDYTVVGSPTISADGVASGLGNNNYINTGVVLGQKPFKICGEALYTGTITGQRILQLGLGAAQKASVYVQNNTNLQMGVTTSDGTSTNKAISNMSGNVLFEFEFTGSKYILRGSTDNGHSWTSNDFTSSLYILNVDTLVLYIGNNFSNGTIDLNYIKIYVDGNLVYQPCLKIPYTESKTGSKIVDSAYRDRVASVYEYLGYAPYYTLSDTDFTLPMGEIYGMLKENWHFVNQNVNNSTAIGTTNVNFAQYIQNPVAGAKYQCLFRYFISSRNQSEENSIYTVTDTTNNVVLLRDVVDSNATDLKSQGGQFTGFLRVSDTVQVQIENRALWSGTGTPTEGIIFLAYKRVI